jgi:hypothetical protein
MRALLLILAFVAATLAAAPLRAPQKQNPSTHAIQSNSSDYIPKDRAADSYAIYSLLMPGRLFQHPGIQRASHWAIAEKTVTFDQMNPRIDPRGILKPPPGNEKAFQQAVHSFELYRYVSYTLQRRLHLDHPYTLLDPQKVRDLQAAKSAIHPGSQLKALYADYPGVTFFSAVYFSNNHNAALVYINQWCGVLCAQGQWVYLEKHDGQWQRMSGITQGGG